MRTEEVNLSERKLIDRNYIIEPEEVKAYRQEEVSVKLRDDQNVRSQSNVEDVNVNSFSNIDVEKKVPVTRAFAVVSDSKVENGADLGQT